MFLLVVMGLIRLDVEGPARPNRLEQNKAYYVKLIIKMLNYASSVGREDWKSKLFIGSEIRLYDGSKLAWWIIMEGLSSKKLEQGWG